MNANELADWIENGAPFGKYETAKQAATMLRQQQAEIANLKAGLLSHHDIYPVKELTLTDEEIGEMMGLDLAMQYSAYMDIVNKVKAILRKAQEK